MDHLIQEVMMGDTGRVHRVFPRQPALKQVGMA